MRKRLCDLGESFWYGSLPDLDAMDEEEFDAHIHMVMDIMEENEPSRAKLYKRGSAFSREFKSVEFQKRWRARQYTLLFDYVESLCTGEAEAELATYDRQEARNIRIKLFKQFGLGAQGDIHDQELHYSAGMPDEGKEPFPPGIDMRAKLRQLSNQRLKFFNLCLPSDRPTYEYCHEKKLVRIIIDHLPEEYKPDISRLLTIVSLRREMQAVKNLATTENGWVWSDSLWDWEWKGEGQSTTPKPAHMDDVQDRAFSDEWLPTYKQLQTCLIDAYVDKMKRKKKAFKNAKGGAPTLITPGAAPADITCYGCGEKGHRRGDPDCPAGPDAIWSGAPTKWKQYQAKLKGGNGGNGKQLCRDFQRPGTVGNS